jgi:hypothetical protein
MCLFQAGQRLLAGCMVAPQQAGGCGKGPRERGVADVLARGPLAFARGLLGTRDEAARRHTILDAGKALASMDCIAHDQGQDFAYAWDRAQTVEGVGVMLLGRPHDRQLQVGQELVIVVNQGQIDLHALVDRRIGQALRHAVAVRFVREFRANLWEVIWASGIVDMRQELRAFPPQRPPPPQSIAGGTHRRRIDVGLGQPATAEAHGHLVRSDLVVCGFAAVARLHG